MVTGSVLHYANETSGEHRHVISVFLQSCYSITQDIGTEKSVSDAYAPAKMKNIVHKIIDA